MVSHYAVIRYVPDPIADERINIGVVVYGQGRVLTRFLDRWQRARKLGGEDPEFLKDFARKLSSEQLTLGGTQRVDEQLLTKYATSWKNSIQLSEPRASLESPDRLLDQMAVRFLHQGLKGDRTGRDKRVAASLAVRALRRAVRQRLQHPPSVMRRSSVPGAIGKHEFDVVVSNGQPYLAADGISFEVPESKALRNEVEATAWAVDDVRKRYPDLPLAVVVLPPLSSVNDSYGEAKRIFPALNAEMVSEHDVDAWADRVAAGMPGH